MPVDRDAVRARFAAGESAKAIAASCHVSPRYIRQIVQPRATAAASGSTPPAASLAFIFALVGALMQRLGPNYGYSVMEGAMRAETGGAYRFPKRHVLHALRTLAPAAYQSRRYWRTLKLPRGSYNGNFFMYSVHMDLTCKLQELGIYVGLIIDGDSRKVLALVALPNKLAATVFERLFFPFLMAFGFPDQLITDKGFEFALCIFMCWYVFNRAGRRCGTDPGDYRMPHRHVFSTYNGRAEKFNFEVNVRTIIPIRYLLDELITQGLMDVHEPACVGAFSALVLPMLQQGLDLLKASWNAHIVRNTRGIPGSGGRPDDRARSRPHPGGQLALPPTFSSSDCMDRFEVAHQKQLRRLPTWAAERDYWMEPWVAPSDRRSRARAVAHILGPVEQQWSDLVNRDFRRFKYAYRYWLLSQPAFCSLRAFNDPRCSCHQCHPLQA